MVSTAWSTTFQPQPIEKQIKESDGLFQGHYLRKKTIALEDGSLATQMFFKMNQEVGLESDFYGMDEVIVHYPGGKTSTQTVKVEGVPEFVPGEKVVLFIKSLDNRYWGMNLGFGSYKVVNYGSDVILVNTIFPSHATVGQVRWPHFEKAVRQIKGINLKTVQSVQHPEEETQVEAQRVPASVGQEGQNRAVASEAHQSENEEEQRSMTMLWLVVALGCLGGIYRLNQPKAHK